MIRFDHVSFRYDERWVVRDLDVHVVEGELQRSRRLGEDDDVVGVGQSADGDAEEARAGEAGDGVEVR